MAIEEKRPPMQRVTDRQLINLKMRAPLLDIDRSVFIKNEKEKQRLKQEKKLWKKAQKKG